MLNLMGRIRLPDMGSHTRNLNPVAGALLGGWLAGVLSNMIGLGAIGLPATALAALFGATRFARPVARLAVALAGGLFAGLLVSLIVGLLAAPLSWLFLIVVPATTAALARTRLELTLRVGNGEVAHRAL